jgi:FKBP-type peptidyl-prolyl cis-trans isomerase
MTRNAGDWMVPGIKIIVESAGTGPAAERGDSIAFESQGYLSRGECVQPRNASTTQLGRRHIIAGVEYALIGMRAGGYRKVRISPHLAYRDQGVSGKIPANAVLIYELWLIKVEKAGAVENCAVNNDELK